MAIRVRHGGVKEYAELGKLAGLAERKRAEAEAAERRAAQLRDIQARQELTSQQNALRLQLSQDQMEFERYKFRSNQEFQLNLQQQKIAHDFEIQETKRLEEQAEVDAAMKAIEGAEGYSPEEKSRQKALYMANRGPGGLPASAMGFGARQPGKEQAEIDAAMKAIEEAEGFSPEEKSRQKALYLANRGPGGLPASAMGFGGASQVGKEELAYDRTVRSILRMQDQIEQKVDFIGEFSKEETGWSAFVPGVGEKKLMREHDGTKRKASNIEKLEYEQAVNDIAQLRGRIGELNRGLNEAPGSPGVPGTDQAGRTGRTGGFGGSGQSGSFSQAGQAREALPSRPTQEDGPTKDVQEQIRDIATTTPESEEHANTLLLNLARLDVEMAKRLRNQWHKTKPWIKESTSPEYKDQPLGLWSGI